jgi:hypothetical protein
VERCARELNSGHEAWKKLLIQLRPASAPNQIASEALEMALKELQERLPSESPTDDHEAVVLDAAMLFIRPRTSRG